MELGKLGSYLSQSEAAAVAVLAANVRERLEVEKDANNEHKNNDAEVKSWLFELERVAIDSITFNDGNVVHWIGRAAKQMNPLLG